MTSSQEPYLCLQRPFQIRQHSRIAGISGVALKNACSAGDARDMGSILGLGRSPGGGPGNPLQYSCLENSMDSGAWQAIVHGLATLQIQLKRLNTHTCTSHYGGRLST